jgi:hypothetical protein
VSVIFDPSIEVDSAFKELECCGETSWGPHEGEVAGLVVWHSCNSGWLCVSHFKWIVEVGLPRLRQTAEMVRCTACNQVMCVDEFVKVHAL